MRRLIFILLMAPLGLWAQFQPGIKKHVLTTNDVSLGTGLSFVGGVLSAPGGGEANVLGNAGATNSSNGHLSWDGPKSGVTLQLLTVSPGKGLIITNESTNLVLAVSFDTNGLATIAYVTAATNGQFISRSSGFGTNTTITNLTLTGLLQGGFTYSNANAGTNFVVFDDGGITGGRGGVSLWKLYGWAGQNVAFDWNGGQSALYTNGGGTFGGLLTGGAGVIASPWLWAQGPQTNDSTLQVTGAQTNQAALNVAGSLNTFSPSTNWSTIRNKAGVTNDSNVRVTGAMEHLSTITNSSWLNTAGGVTNYSTLNQVGLQTNQGTLDITGPLVSHTASTNRSTLRQMGGQTNDANLLVVGAAEFRSTETNSSWLNVAGGVTNYSTVNTVGLQTNQGTLDVTGPLVSHVASTNRGTVRNMGGVTNDVQVVNVGSVEDRNTVTNSGAINNAAGVTNWSNMLIIGAAESRSTSTNTGAINNAAGVTNWSNVLNVGALENRSTTTNTGAINNGGAQTNWNSDVWKAMKQGVPTLVASPNTTNQIDFSIANSYKWTNMVTNIVLQLTNFLEGAELDFYFTGATNTGPNYTVQFSTNGSPGILIRWGSNSATNGATSFTVTNNTRVTAYAKVWNETTTTNVEAYYQYLLK